MRSSPLSCRAVSAWRSLKLTLSLCALCALCGGLTPLLPQLGTPALAQPAQADATPKKKVAKGVKKSKKTSAKKRSKLSAKERAKRDFKRGSQAFAKERWAQALKYFKRAYKAYPLPLMIYNIASTYERLGDLPRALERYEAFVATGKDDGEAEGRVKSLRATLEGWAELKLSSSPSRARVYVGDKKTPRRARTPATLKLPPNQEVKLILSRKGYQDEVISTRFKPKERRALKVDLKGKPAFVQVVGAPREAEVRVDGKAQAQKGLPMLLELGVGRHELEVLAPGYIPQRKSVTLKTLHHKGAPLVVEVSLSSSEGVALVQVSAPEEGTLVFVDGRPVGQTPLRAPLQLSPGAHLFEFKGGSGGLYSERVSVKAGESAEVSATFDDPSPFTRSRVGLGLTALGGASLLGGLISGGVAMSSSSDLETCRADVGCARKQGELDLAQEVRFYASMADWMVGAGLVMSAGGLALYFLDQARASTLSPSVAPAPQGDATPSAAQGAFEWSLSPTLGGLSAAGRFNF